MLLCPCGTCSGMSMSRRGDSITGSAAIGTIPGYDEFDLSKYLVIYPNPNRGHFSILISLPELDPVMLKVFTSEGQLVLENRLGSFAGVLQEDIDLSEAGPGVYYVQVISARGTSVKKVVVH